MAAFGEADQGIMGFKCVALNILAVFTLPTGSLRKKGLALRPLTTLDDPSDPFA
jgi:hypothetical protein